MSRRGHVRDARLTSPRSGLRPCAPSADRLQAAAPLLPRGARRQRSVAGQSARCSSAAGMLQRRRCGGGPPCRRPSTSGGDGLPERRCGTAGAESTARAPWTRSFRVACVPQAINIAAAPSWLGPRTSLARSGPCAVRSARGQASPRDSRPPVALQARSAWIEPPYRRCRGRRTSQDAPPLAPVRGTCRHEAAPPACVRRRPPARHGGRGPRDLRAAPTQVRQRAGAGGGRQRVRRRCLHLSAAAPCRPPRPGRPLIKSSAGRGTTPPAVCWTWRACWTRPMPAPSRCTRPRRR